MKYNKLVRDKIPDIVRQKGGKPVIHVASAAEYDAKAREKLREELEEFLASNSPEALAGRLGGVKSTTGKAAAGQG